MTNSGVFTAKAGTQMCAERQRLKLACDYDWIPAFAGKTPVGKGRLPC